MRTFLLSSVVVVLSTANALAQVTMQYTHQAGSITSPSRTLFGGDTLLTNTSPYSVSGDGTNQLQIVDPSVTPPNYELLAIAAPSGAMSAFYGGSVTGTMTISGVYSVSGAPSSGAIGSLQGTATYYNFLTAVGLSKLTGTASSTLASKIAVSPFPLQTPGPTPATTTLNAPIGVATAGSLTTNVAVPYTAAATGIKDGVYPVNLTISVTASRTHGASQATAAWIGQTFNWTLTTPPVGTGGTATPIKKPTPRVGSLLTPAPRQGNVSRMFAANSPENLVLDSDGVLQFSAVDATMSSDPRDIAADGMQFGIGEALGLEYISDLERSPDGQLVAVEFMTFAGGQFNTSAGQLFTVDPTAGTTTVVPLSTALAAPTAIAFPQSGFAGAEMLLTELGSGPSGQPSLHRIDNAGIVVPVVADLSVHGIDNPSDLQLAPSNFGGFGSHAFVINVGSFTETSAVADSGSIASVNPVDQTVSVFATGLSNPIAATFADGALVGDPGASYLYVLEQGDLDPDTGVLLGNGTLSAYDAGGTRTVIAGHIERAASVRASADGLAVYFADGQFIYAVDAARPAVWDGRSLIGNQGDGNLWSVADNWTTEGVVDTLPGDAYPGYDVVLPTTPTVGNIFLGQDRTVNTIRFEDDYQLVGNTLTVSSGGLAVASGVVATINADLVLPAATPELFPAVKTGDGTLLVHGQIEGDLTILEGRFVPSGDMSGNIVVESGTLTGSGSIAGQVHVYRGGQLLLDAAASSLTIGDLLLDQGTQVTVELADPGVPLDDLAPALAAGTAQLAGELAVSLIDGFVPERLDTLTLLAAPSIEGMFENVVPGERLETADGLGSFLLSKSEANDAVLLSDYIVGLAGDLTDDNAVGGADLIAWQRGNVTSPTWTADLAAIQSNFGSNHNQVAGALAAVPEPTATMLVSLAGLFTLASTRGRLRTSTAAALQR